MISEAKNEDKDRIIRIIDSIYREYGDSICLEKADADLLDIESNYQREGGMFWKFIKDGEIIGTVAVYKDKRSSGAWLKRMYVVKPCRGQGVADRLMKMVIDWCIERGLEKISLWSDTRFIRGHAFYEKYGFVKGIVQDRNDGNMPYSEFYFEKNIQSGKNI